MCINHQILKKLKIVMFLQHKTLVLSQYFTTEKSPKITLGFQGQDPGKWAGGEYLGCQLCEEVSMPPPLTVLHLISSICQGNCNNRRPQESPSQSWVQVKKTPRIPSLLLQSLHLKLGLISQTQFLVTVWFGFKTLHPLLFSGVSSLTAVIESLKTNCF